MEIFYSNNIDGQRVLLGEEESGHCIRVLRHRRGDEISVIDGRGTLMRCVIEDDSPKGAAARIVGRTQDWGGHPYVLDLAVCPTKNADRYEWFVEKACEIGVDRVIPLIGERSERRVVKSERLVKIALSAAKQSLKARVTAIDPPTGVRDFICGDSVSDGQSSDGFAGGIPGPSGRTVADRTGAGERGALKLIACCFEDETVPRVSVKDALDNWRRKGGAYESGSENGGKDGEIGPADRHVQILIGPEGDFSPDEVRLAVSHGFIPVSLGPSRLRTETAAVLAASAVYLHFM